MLPNIHINHYSDVIMNAMTYLIPAVSIDYSTVCSGADRRKHQIPASLAFVRGIHRWPVNYPHKGPVSRKKLPFDYVIMTGGMAVRYATTNRAQLMNCTHAASISVPHICSSVKYIRQVYRQCPNYGTILHRTNNEQIQTNTYTAYLCKQSIHLIQYNL